MKIIRSVRDTQGNIIQKQPDVGTGQQRCLKCHNMCITQRRADGKTVSVCGGCGAQYVSQGLGGPKPLKIGAVPRRPPSQNGPQSRNRAVGKG